MSDDDLKDDLTRYLQTARDAVLSKLDGASEYDVRRPSTRTGTNLLGLVKHLAIVELGYFGIVFGRPPDEPMPWYADDAETNSDMWATADESRAEVVALYRRAWAHADATIAALPLDERGRVPWWQEGRNDPTLHRVLVHVVAETDRHAGHADIVRELLDGTAGMDGVGDNLPEVDDAWWAGYRERLEQVARDVARG